MAGENRQAGGRNLIAAQAFACLVAALALSTPAHALSDKFAPASYVGPIDPSVLWEALIGGIVVCAFLAALAIWIQSALRWLKRSQLRRTAYISTALNSLSHGVVMTDPKQRIVFCNDRYLEIYGLARSDLSANMSAPELLELRRQRGCLDTTNEKFFTILGEARRPDYRIAGRAFHSGQIFCAAEWRVDRDP